jgi:hypothetical protein
MSQPVRVFREFITPQDHKELLNSAMMLYSNGIMRSNVRGSFRRFLSLDRDCDQKFFFPKVQHLYSRISNVLQITDPVIDPSLGILLSVIEPNGFIQKHNDPYKQDKDKVNLRFNIMVNRGPSEAYNPRVDKKLYRVEERDAWLFNATDFYHSTLANPGPELRIVYQFGFMVDRAFLPSLDIAAKV